MVWFKVDDRLPLNPKMAGVSIAAVGLWVEAGAWASASQTDGQVLKRMLCVLHPDASEKLAGELVAAGLWEDQGDHWQIHDFLDYNPPREEVEAKKARRSRAGKLGGIKSGKSRRSKREANAEAKHEAKTNPVPVSYISTYVDISPKPPTGVKSDEQQIWQPSSEPTVEFTQFWSLYPNHDYEDAAVREFRRVRRRRISLVALLQGAQMLRDEHRDPRYIPAASKWLHDGGWKNRPRPRSPVSSSGMSRAQQNEQAQMEQTKTYAQRAEEALRRGQELTGRKELAA